MIKKYTRKSDISKQTKGKKKERNTCGYRGACISKDYDWTKGRGFNENEKRSKTKVTTSGEPV